LTQERLSDSPPADLSPESLEAFEATLNIEDLTSPEVDALVDRDLGDTAAEDEIPATQEAEAEAAEPSVDQPDTPVAEEPAQPAETELLPEPEPSAERTFTQDEWSKRDSAWRRQDAEKEKRLLALEQQSQANQAETYVEQAAQQTEANLTPTYGAEEARRLARDPAAMQGYRAAIENLQLKQVIQQQETQSEAQAKAMSVQHFVTLHNVADADRELLATAGSPEAMDALAKRLGNPAPAARPAPRVESKVPAGSAERLETGESTAPALNNEARMNQINDKHQSEWNEADVKFMNDLMSGRIEL